MKVTAFIRKSSEVGYGIRCVRFYDLAIVDESGKRIATESGKQIAPHELKGAAADMAAAHGCTLGEVWTSEGKGYAWVTLVPIWAGGRRSKNPMAELINGGRA